MKDKILEVFFVVIYFLIFYFIIDLVFRNTLSIVTDILAVVCWIVAFVVSVGLADYTMKLIKDK